LFACLFALPSLLTILQGCGNNTTDSTEIITWGLKLQIGGYVLDSIFSDTTSNRFGTHGDSDKKYYRVNMDNIKTKVPDYLEAPHIGKIYGWNPDCFRYVVFMFLRGGGQVLPDYSYSYSDWQGPDYFLETDTSGNFDFSSIKEYYTEQEGVQFWIIPKKFSKYESDKLCYPKNNHILVQFSL